MKRRFILTALLLSATFAMVMAATPAPTAADKTDSWDKYRMVVLRNMFLKDRSKAHFAGSVSRPGSTGGLRPEDIGGFVLTGVGYFGPQRVAFFESTDNGATTRIAVGQALGKGRVVSVTLDTVAYEHGGATTQIAIGQNLAGMISALPTLGPTASAAPAPGAASRPTGGEGGESTSRPAGGPGTEATASTASATATAASAPSTPASTAADSVEERMRKRRAKEENQ